MPLRDTVEILLGHRRDEMITELKVMTVVVKFDRENGETYRPSHSKAYHYLWEGPEPVAGHKAVVCVQDGAGRHYKVVSVESASPGKSDLATKWLLATFDPQVDAKRQERETLRRQLVQSVELLAKEAEKRERYDKLSNYSPALTQALRELDKFDKEEGQ